jgi:hypothetical protein
MVRVYGTAKPSIGTKSTFPEVVRVPDPALRSYLLQLTTNNTRPMPPRKNLVLTDSMPAWFPSLRKNDRVLNDLWHGRGKPGCTDQTNSGYDFSIACFLSQRTDKPEEIAKILSHRPMGSEERNRKGMEYLERTVNNALAKRRKE